MSNYLFAIDEKTNEVIVSVSAKGRTTIDLVERIARKDHDILYQAVVTLTMLARADEVEEKTFNAMDKVCQLLYSKRAVIKK